MVILNKINCFLTVRTVSRRDDTRKWRLRPTLAPEFPVYASLFADNLEQATAGITDATSFGEDGKPKVVIDWKSDVQPSPETIEHYRAQVRNYLEMTDIERGLIVLVTSGLVLPVSPCNRSRLATCDPAARCRSWCGRLKQELTWLNGPPPTPDLSRVICCETAEFFSATLGCHLKRNSNG